MKFPSNPLKPIIVAALLLGASACDRGEAPPSPVQTGTPAIWEITSDGGAVEGWLFGTIHALPDNTRWRSEPVEQAIAEADLLAMEIAALEDTESIAMTFLGMSHSPGQPLLTERLPASQHEELAELIERSPYDAGDFRAIESWGAALILAQTNKGASKTENGVDKALATDFQGRRPIREIEGVQAQLGVFDALPEADQRDLLSLTVEETTRPDSFRQKTVQRWLAGDVEALLDPDAETLLDDPELREALVEGRNRDWMPVIVTMLQQQPKPLIAVGAGHMGGPQGLPVLLRKAGYTVTRMR
ncbi:TraB/GumN family protein [Qipengyuania sp. DSG2-2]|uniref:TraB/GumN family protein n=1 Tax=Qipengyuania sp. DGS2-2 TaxID=3349631 RepID=UPI0036D40AF4